MTWNISFSLVTAVILCTLLVYYAVNPRLPIMLNRFFVALAVAEMLTLIFDIISTWMDINHQDFSVWLLILINMIYFLLFVVRSYVMYAYTTALIASRTKLPVPYMAVGWILATAFLLLSLTSLFTGAVFSIDQDGYQSGPLYNAIYVQMFLFLILGLLVLIRYRKELHEKEFGGILVCYAILIAGGFFRFAFSHFLLMDTFYMLAIMVLYITIHNVDLHLESRTMLFDYQAFEQVVREHHNQGTWYHLIEIMNCNYGEARQIYGGAQMDRMLSLIGRYLRETFRSSTVFYERSGCFLVMTEGKETADKVVSEVLPVVSRRLNEPWDSEDVRVFLNFIFGQMDMSLETGSVDMELEAVRNLLERGVDGRIDHDFIVDQNMIGRIAREFAVNKALSNALRKYELQVYMQPIIEAATERVAGAEALARLEDQKLGLILPGEFIPLAERSGSIIRIGKQVLAKTCSFLRENKEVLSDLDFININLSPIQCMDQDLAKTFEEVPKTYGVDPRMLHLEITEESMVDPEVLKGKMEILGLLGYSFALDDYGSGYANHFRIKTFPFSGIKLDMKIVWAHFREPDPILPNSVMTFLDRGLTVTAEGVESEEMARQLTEMGCTYLQGFYYSKPLPMEEFIQFCLSRSERD